MAAPERTRYARLDGNVPGEGNLPLDHHASPKYPWAFKGARLVESSLPVNAEVLPEPLSRDLYSYLPR